MAVELTLTDVARALSVSPATLRRWVADGIVPLRDGAWTPAALAQARIVARLRAARPQPRAVAARGARRAGWPTATSRTCSRRPTAAGRLEDAARETGLEPELIRRIWPAPASRPRRWSTSPTTISRCCAAWPRCWTPGCRWSPSCNSSRVRPGAGAHRRRRGQALPPLRPRADDPRRRARAGHRRGALRPRLRAAPAVRPDHGLSAPAAPAALHRAGRGRPPRAGRRRRRRSAACASRSCSPTSRDTPG